MLIFFIISIAPSYPIYASVCMLWVSSICVVSLSPCLAKMLALHSEPIFVKMIFVQVCSESVGHAEWSELVNMLSSRYNSTSPIKAGNDAGTRQSFCICYHTDKHKQVPSFSLSIDLASAQMLACRRVKWHCTEIHGFCRAGQLLLLPAHPKSHFA